MWVDRLGNDGGVLFFCNNPYFAEHFALDEIIVIGGMGARLLSEHPDADWVQRGLTVGEFCGSVMLDEDQRWLVE